MSIKDKVIEYKNRAVDFYKKHKIEVICGASALAGFIAACVLIKNDEEKRIEKIVNKCPVSSLDWTDFDEFDEEDDEDEIDIVDQYDWDEKDHANNWELIKKCAEGLKLEDGEWYSFENVNSHNDGLPIGETQIFHGLEPFGRDDVFPEEDIEDDEDDELPDDIEIVKGNDILLKDSHYRDNFLSVLEFARGLSLDHDESYIIEKNDDDDRTMISLRKKN